MNHNRREQGSNLVEMALAMFILVILLIGVVDIGRAFQSYIVITNASREGARRASRLPDPIHDSQIREAVIQEAANSNVDLSGTDAFITVNRVGTLALGDPISVTVEYTFTTFIGGLVGMRSFPMSHSTTMAIFGYRD